MFIDSFDIRFSLRSCEIAETTHYTTFTCPNEATYILSRKCTNEYYGAAGPCCKVDDLINYIMNDRPEFGASLKYALHCDDDTFWRADQVLKWLAAIDKSGAAVHSTFFCFVRLDNNSIPCGALSVRR